MRNLFQINHSVNMLFCLSLLGIITSIYIITLHYKDIVANYYVLLIK